MLLAVDIGNSFAKFGIFDGTTLLEKFTIPSIRNADASFFQNELAPRLHFLDSAVISSVVPEFDEPLSKFLNATFDIEAIRVDSTFDLGLTICYEPSTAVGIDRIVAASAALKYGTPVIICDLGTATTIDAVDSDKNYLGGTIAPGMNTMASSLREKTSKLPQISIDRTENIIGNTTELSIRSGVFWGYVGLVEGLIARIRTEVTGSPKVIATGGFAEIIAAETRSIDIVETDLILRRLAELNERL
jgi:type III pantothenate kinase